MFRLLDRSRFLRITVVFSAFLLVAVLLRMLPAASPAVQGASFQWPSSGASRSLNLTPAVVGPIELLSPIELKSPLRSLSAGAPQTITLEVVPATLIAHSGATAVVTATVVDLTGTPVSGVILSGSITPTERGTLSGLSATDQDGKSVGTWTATALSTVGVGTIEVFTDTISGSAPITLTADTPATVTLSAYPLIRTVGETSILTATVVDQYGSPVDDGTLVTFTSNIGIVASPHSTSSGIATSTITSTQVGTAYITATSVSRSGFASVTFNPGLPYTVTLSAYPSVRTVGETSTLTATVVDQYGSPVDDGTLVTFTSNIGIVVSPRSTSSGVATSTITSTQVGTAYITATSVSRSGFASVTFNPHTVFLPLVMRADLRDIYSMWSLQFYDRLAAYNGFEYATAAGVRWVRLRVSWFDIEPTNTTPVNYNWSALDQTIAAARNAKINLIVTLEGNPTWVSSRPQGPVNNLNEFKQFVGALAARYPSVQYWEIYNEPDNIYSFGDQPAAYAAQLNAAYTAIKAVNPNAKIVMGGVGMDWFTDQGGNFVRTFVNDMLTACTQPCFDIGNFHYYPVYRGKWEPWGRDIIGKANALRQMLSAKGYSRPVMNTETGWVYSTIPNTDWGGEAIQSRYVPKTFVRGMAAGLITTNWYAMIDTDESLPGLLGNRYPSFQVRQAYTATLKLSQQLGAAKYERALTQAETGSPTLTGGLEGYVFTNYADAHGTERVDIIWYDCASLIVDTPDLPVDCLNAAVYHVPAATIGVADHLGGAMQILTDGSDGTLDGKVSLWVNRNPVYIHYNP